MLTKPVNTSWYVKLLNSDAPMIGYQIVKISLSALNIGVGNQFWFSLADVSDLLIAT